MKTLKTMVDRFLSWGLPKDFGPDCGISFDGRRPDAFNPSKTWPVGTNLLTADQATAMFQHCAADVIRDAERYRKWRAADMAMMDRDDDAPPDWFMHLAVAEGTLSFDQAIDSIPESVSSEGGES